jgi:hypothetical protein
VKEVQLRADVQVWVCVNEREVDSRIASCGKVRGDAVLAALRSRMTPMLAKRRFSVWFNRTLCQGFCHADGVTVTIETALGHSPLKFQAVNGEVDVDAIVARVEMLFS